MAGRSRQELARDMGMAGGGRPYQSPGARKEKLRERAYRRGGGGSGPPYAELRAASAFSFLDGASLPEDLVARAAELDLPAVALIDRNGVPGAPRFWKAAKAAGIRALVGSEVSLAAGGGGHPRNSKSKDIQIGKRQELRRRNERDDREVQRSQSASGKEESGLSPALESLSCSFSSSGPSSDAAPRASAARRLAALALPRLTLLVESREGYRNLCKLVTAAAAGRPKGEAAAEWAAVEEHAAGLHVLTGGDESPLARLLDNGGIDAARGWLERLAAAFPGRVHVELQRHGRRDEERRNRALVELARRLRLPLVATNGARFARAADKPLFDVLTSIREHVTLDEAGARLAVNRERHLKGADEMARLFPDRREAVAHAHELAGRLAFTLDDLGYRFPDYPVPRGESRSSYLAQITWSAARARFRPLSAKAQAQLGRELELIAKLDLAGYFLIVWDLVEFCRREKILCQGRGSAANSAVCYALGITAIDPVRMELLFERFLSEERGEWPDIDLDLPSGDQREKVIQYVFRRYGAPSGARAPAGVSAAMTANVITKQLGSWRYDLERGDPKSFEREMRAGGFDPEERRIRLFGEYWRKIQNLPRHLGQHSGGMVIAAGRLDEVVPLEPAAMPGRVVVQWDKDDCADLGIIKIDLLGLGMLDALERVIPIVREKERTHLDLAHLPPDDPEVYRMLRAADTVGVFQVESRAQMASLPRNAPTRFYDLVIQVAIIRPGPITGGMVHPFFERRLGREEVTYFHPALEPILARTLGVPIFQEQLLRMAMAVSGFTGGEAEELRRAMGFKRSVERMEAIERRLRAGMAERGIVGENQDRIVQSITSFALYGFPESHAASFALIAYASAYLKCHHPTAFLVGLLNAWPMGFYHPATLVKDAQRHGVTVLPIDVNFSGVECVWEERKDKSLVQDKNERLSDRGKTRDGDRIRSRVPESPVRAFENGTRSEDPRRAGGMRWSRGAETRRGPERPTWRASARGGSVASTVRAPRRGASFEATRSGPGSEPSGTGATPRRSEVRPSHPPPAPGACRLGLRYVEGLRKASAEAIVEARRRGGRFRDADDLARRARLRGDELERLAAVGALASLGLARREALWQAALAARPAGELFEGTGETDRRGGRRSPLPEMTRYERTVADFEGTGVTVGAHPLAYWRARLERRGVMRTADLPRLARGTRAKIAGAVIVRQRPGTAKGTLFLTLEDESGMAQAIVAPALFHELRPVIVGSPGLIVEGIVEARDGSVSLRAERVWALPVLAETPSHDFR